MPLNHNKMLRMRILNPNSRMIILHIYLVCIRVHVRALSVCPIGIGHMGNLQLAAVLGYQHNEEEQ